MLLAGLLLAASAGLRAYAGPESVCGIGDLHGDVQHTLAAFALCGAADASGRWTGGTMTVVQVGDVVDRGNASLAVLRTLWELRAQAAAAGGELVLLIGNHELMNMQGRTHYVDRSELAREGGAAVWKQRMHPLRGDIGAALLTQDAVAVRGGGPCRTLFVHAGVRAATASKYGNVDRLNEGVRAQLAAGGYDAELLDPTVGPLWWRGYARPATASMSDEQACDELSIALSTLDASAARMAVGHNIVPWISTRCAGRLTMLDVGMSSAYGGLPAAWRCDVTEQGQALTRALYYQEDDGASGVRREVAPPPELCDACARFVPDGGGGDQATATRQAHAWHDCRDYCKAPRMEL